MLIFIRNILKVIDLVLFNIYNRDNEILAVYYKNKAIEAKDICHQMNILDIKSLLRTNCRMPLLHMSKSYIWLEETNQRINGFSIG